jgi:uncharacterized protein with HEPN domain
MRDEAAFLWDMLDSALTIQRYAASRDVSDLRTDSLFQDAVLWRIGVIGEAARNVSEQTRAALPQMPFEKMAGMRNKIVHHYWEIDWNVVVDVVSVQLPKLILELKARLPAADVAEAEGDHA